MNTDDVIFTIRVPYENDSKFYRIQTKWHDTGFTLSILENDVAYFSKISFEQLKQLAVKYKENYDEYYAKIRRCFVENCTDTVLYNCKNNELLLSRRQGRIIQQFACFTLNESSFSQIALELIDELVQLNTTYKDRVILCQNETKKVETEKIQYATKLDNYVTEKADMEHELYSKFILLLNQKKYRLQNLQDMLTCNRNGNYAEFSDNSESETKEINMRKVIKRLEVVSDSDTSNTDEEGAEKITCVVQIEKSDSPKIELDFLDDNLDDLPSISALPKRAKMSDDKDNIIKDSNLDYLDKDTIPLIEETVASTSGIKNNVTAKPAEEIVNGDNTQDSLNFNTQDLFDRL